MANFNYPKKIKTKFGIAKINNKGYYRITSRKEGNYRKLLHRLIWEDCYGELNSNKIIHHIDNNTLNNCIWNLEPMSKVEHTKYHHRGFQYTDSSKKKISKSKNSSGYYRVSKRISEKFAQGFVWRYCYYDDNKQKEITSVDLNKLEQKVKERGLEWCKV